MEKQEIINALKEILKEYSFIDSEEFTQLEKNTLRKINELIEQIKNS